MTAKSSAERRRELENAILKWDGKIRKFPLQGRPPSSPPSLSPLRRKQERVYYINAHRYEVRVNGGYRINRAPTYG